MRTGVRELTVAKTVARLSPLTLKTSQVMRLARVAKGAVYKEDLAQLVVPLRSGTDPASFLVDLLRQLVGQEVTSTPP